MKTKIQNIYDCNSKIIKVIKQSTVDDRLKINNKDRKVQNLQYYKDKKFIIFPTSFRKIKAVDNIVN